MLTCPNGHVSEAADFCSVCGVEMNAASAAVLAAPTTVSPTVASTAQPCPVCGAGRDPLGGDFCEVCGYNFRTGVGGIPLGPDAGSPALSAPAAAAVPQPADGSRNAVDPEQQPNRASSITTRWELRTSVVPGETDAPAGEPERLFLLENDEALIGRRSARRNIAPEIALDADDGVSHRHARLLRQPDGRFALLDLGSANGTRLNGTDLPPNVLSAPLKDGDRIELGRWTCLTVRTRDSPESCP